MRVYQVESTGLKRSLARGRRRVDGIAHAVMCVTERPALTIDTKPTRLVISEEEASPMPTDRPPYVVPSMDEIRALPWNGLTVASTFSGCGGSSLGYRMAGFRVLWASEFVEAARAVYRANAADYTKIDERDIRVVQPEELLEATGLQRGELDLLDGSPPCASFSTAGARSKGWGKIKKYSETEQRSDDLFFEFARILEGVQPRTFVAENVSGLVKGSAKGYFRRILERLKGCGYRVAARLLDAQWLGVPQVRQRLIFVGVRADLDPRLQPAHPKPLPYRYSVREACPWIVRATQDTGGWARDVQFEDRPAPTITVGTGNSHHFKVEAEASMTRYATGPAWEATQIGEASERYFQLVRPDPERPCPTVTASGGNPGLASVAHPYECRKFSIAELRRICGFPDDFVLLGTYAQQWERLGRAVPPVMMRHIAATVRDRILLPDREQREGAFDVL